MKRENGKFSISNGRHIQKFVDLKRGGCWEREREAGSIYGWLSKLGFELV